MFTASTYADLDNHSSGPTALPTIGPDSTSSRSGRRPAATPPTEPSSSLYSPRSGSSESAEYSELEERRRARRLPLLPPCMSCKASRDGTRVEYARTLPVSTTVAPSSAWTPGATAANDSSASSKRFTADVTASSSVLASVSRPATPPSWRASAAASSSTMPRSPAAFHTGTELPRRACSSAMRLAALSMAPCSATTRSPMSPNVLSGTTSTTGTRGGPSGP